MDSGVVASIGHGSVSKTHMKILGLTPKPTGKFWVCPPKPTACLGLPPSNENPVSGTSYTCNHVTFTESPFFSTSMVLNEAI